MRPLADTLAFVVIATGISLIAGFSLLVSPQPPDNLVALRKCMALHPERYCRLTHAPSTISNADY